MIAGHGTHVCTDLQFKLWVSPSLQPLTQDMRIPLLNQPGGPPCSSVHYETDVQVWSHGCSQCYEVWALALSSSLLWMGMPSPFGKNLGPTDSPSPIVPRHGKRLMLGRARMCFPASKVLHQSSDAWI
jgi:hypothetical protein